MRANKFGLYFSLSGAVEHSASMYEIANVVKIRLIKYVLYSVCILGWFAFGGVIHTPVLKRRNFTIQCVCRFPTHDMMTWQKSCAPFSTFIFANNSCICGFAGTTVTK